MKSLFILFFLLTFRAISIGQCDTVSGTLENSQTFLSFNSPLAAQIAPNTVSQLCYAFVPPADINGGFFLISYATLGTIVVPLSIEVYDTSCTLVSSGPTFAVDPSYTSSYTVCFKLSTTSFGSNPPPVTVLPYFYYNAAPLSAVWGEIEASQYGQGVRVMFVTLSESNVDYFTVQASKDLLSWEEFEQIPGQGTKTTSTSYSSFVPWEGAVKQIIYVRVEERDFNGVASYSHSVPVLLVIEPKAYDRMNGYDLSGRRLKR